MAKPRVVQESVRDRIGDAEWQARIELAAAFRIAHQLGWNDGVNNHVTYRVPGSPEHFLMNPHGLGWDEITASSLLKAHVSGHILVGGELQPQPAGLNFHSAILAAKPDLACSMHIHPMAGVVVSTLEQDLVILDQRGCALFGEVAYHDYEGYAREKDEGPRIVSDLGDRRTMIMRNHGLLAVGRTLGETFHFMGKLIGASELLERALATGVKLRPLTEEIIGVAQRQTKARYSNKPLGELEWRMRIRRLERQDPTFAT
jgi:ribulose-5-phosphate 4-epimerase/fuculose-1-phosphate aldolase